MTDDRPSPESQDSTDNRLPRFALFAVLLILSVWQGAMMLRREFNWDEYYFLSFVFEYRQGTLAQPLQTFHVHIFSWLADLPWVDSNRLVAGRSVMLVLHVATLGLLYGLTRRLATPAAAVWAVALYGSLEFVLIHGTSFRADPLITFLLVAACYLLTARPLTFPVILAAFLASALAILISIKATLYLPIIAGILALQLRWSTTPRQDAGRISGALVLAAVAYAGAFGLHSLSLGPPPTTAARDLLAIAKTQLGTGDLIPGWRFLVRSLMTNFIFYALALSGVIYAMRILIRPASPDREKAALMLVLAAPLLLPLIYRNSFPYAYVFIMAPPAVVAGYAASRLQQYWRAMALILAAGICLSLPAFQRGQTGQRAVEAVVHRMFPAAVPYFDRCGMIASFPLANAFMSQWGLRIYLQAGQPTFAEAIAQLHPPLLLVTHPVLEEALGLALSAPTGGMALLPRDAAALRDNYIPHWGPVWVAGKRLPFSDAESGFDLAIPGSYTFEGPAAGTIDGMPVSRGQVVMLKEGQHTYRGPMAILRYGDHLIRPDDPPPPPFFLGF